MNPQHWTPPQTSLVFVKKPPSKNVYTKTKILTNTIY